MAQLEWIDKYTEAAEVYLCEAQGHEMIEDHSDCEDPYFITSDPEDDALVFTLLQAWDEDMPHKVDSEWRSWCENKMSEYLSKDLEFPRIQKIRFDILDMLVFEKRALLRHHINALGEGL